MESGEILVGDIGRGYQMQMIVVDKLEYLLIRRQHAVQIARRRPSVGAEIQRQCDDRDQPVGFIESRQKFGACFRHLIFGAVRSGGLLGLCDVLHGVVQHVSHRHRVMQLGLVFYPEQQIRRPAVLHRRDAFQHVAVSLYRLGTASADVRQRDGGGVKRPELLRLYDLLAAVDQKIEGVGEHRAVLHVFLCHRVPVRQSDHLPAGYIISLL